MLGDPQLVLPTVADLGATQSAEGPVRSGRESHGNRTYAALDLGTNNCRLLVARPSSEGFRVVDAFSRIVRLGEGLGASNRLRDIAITRTIEALHVCRSKMEGRGVSRARLIATEACRAAVNGADFVARVRDETDLELEVVDLARREGGRGSAVPGMLRRGRHGDRCRGGCGFTPSGITPAQPGSASG
jgi:exopolyphosphatase/guanosine-5'-triphosphate,3'-diphosphate pyrophosphatase